MHEKSVRFAVRASLVAAVALTVSSAAIAESGMTFPEVVIDALSRSDASATFACGTSPSTSIPRASTTRRRSRFAAGSASRRRRRPGSLRCSSSKTSAWLPARIDYAPERAGFATIVDPEQTEVNRAYLRYRGISRLDIGLGRQRIVLDNQRFVGNVGWRQDSRRSMRSPRRIPVSRTGRCSTGTWSRSTASRTSSPTPTSTSRARTIW